MDNRDRKNLLATNRRTFLAGTSILASGAPFYTLGHTLEHARDTTKKDTDHWQQPRRCVFQHLPYVSFDGVGESYEAPYGNKSTRDYLDSISREEYLRRHWFI